MVATFGELVARGDAATIRLTSTQENLRTFHQEMDVDNSIRRHAEEKEIGRIREHLARLERTLTCEVRRRVATSRALQSSFEAHMATMQDKLEGQLVQKIDELHQSVESLHARVDNVEREYSQARETYIQDIEDKRKMLSMETTSLLHAFQQEWDERKERETLIIAKLRDLEERTTERFTRDSDMMASQAIQLREDLDVSKELYATQFKEYVFEAMAALRNGLVMETRAREHADDEIVKALTHYTQSVQDAMRIINTAEVRS